MLFYYDRISGKTGVEQFRTYLGNEIYLSELKKDTHDLVNYQLIEARRAIQEGSRSTNASIEKLTSIICGTLENGLNAIIEGIGNNNCYLNEANEKLNDIYVLLDWKTDLIIEEQKITNFYLGNIERLLNKPEEFKRSCSYLERGMALLVNGIDGGPTSEFYDEALSFFLKAHEIDNIDFLCLQKLGMIYYSCLNQNDPQRALDYFLKSSRYAIAFSKTVSSGFNQTYLHSFTKEKLLEEAASSLDYAARCSYILDKLSDSILYSRQAIQLQPNTLSFQFSLAKYLSANGEIENAVILLEELIKKDENYSVKVLIEQDLVTKSPVSSMIERLRSKLENEISSALTELRQLKKYSKNEYANQFDFMERMFSDKSYLNLRKIQAELFKQGLYEKMREDATKKKEFIESKTRDNISTTIIGIPLLLMAAYLWFNSSDVTGDNSPQDMTNFWMRAGALFFVFLGCGLMSIRYKGLDDGKLNAMKNSFLLGFGCGVMGMFLGSIYWLFNLHSTHFVLAAFLGFQYTGIAVSLVNVIVAKFGRSLMEW